MNETLIQRNVSLHDKNWFQTGGPAHLYAEPRTTDEFASCIQYAQKHAIPIFVLGKGANILISDDGFDGLVIRPQLLNIQVIETNGQDVLVQAGAGVSIHDLIVWCLDHTIIGLEEFAGIPGTVGGSVYINLHYFEFLLEQFLHSAHVIDSRTGCLMHVEPSWFGFDYDQSRLQEKNYYLACATFKLKQATELETAYARGRRVEIIRHRERRYPSTHTCGSFFRNFHDNEVTLISSGKKMIHVAYYLDKIGVKGQLQRGDAIVSWQHANMIVNKGNASSNDIISLARTMQQLVKDTFGVVPQPECQLIGFKEWPLL